MPLPILAGGLERTSGHRAEGLNRFRSGREFPVEPGLGMTYPLGGLERAGRFSMRNSKCNRRGFTLVEVSIVVRCAVSIIAALALVGYVRYRAHRAHVGSDAHHHGDQNRTGSLHKGESGPLPHGVEQSHGVLPRRDPRELRHQRGAVRAETA